MTQKPVRLGRGCMRKKWFLRDATIWWAVKRPVEIRGETVARAPG